MSQSATDAITRIKLTLDRSENAGGEKRSPSDSTERVGAAANPSGQLTFSLITTPRARDTERTRQKSKFPQPLDSDSVKNRRREWSRLNILKAQEQRNRDNPKFRKREPKKGFACFEPMIGSANSWAKFDLGIPQMLDRESDKRVSAER